MIRYFIALLLLWPAAASFAQTFTLVKDINTTSNGSDADNYTAATGGITYFTAQLHNTLGGRKLFKTDGTTAGTQQVSNLDVDRMDMLFLNDKLYFSRNNTLWSTDGTEAGTSIVKTSGTIPQGVQQLVASNGRIFFIASTGSTGYEPWVSDGTDAGTFLLKDIYPGTTGSNNPGYSSYFLTNVNGVVFFSAQDSPANGFELWKTDGTEAGTVMVKNINTNANTSSSPRYLTALGSTLFFTADNTTNGEELWKSDGTSAGTVLVRDIVAGVNPSFVSGLTAFGSELYFMVGSGTMGLWKTNGTSAGTVVVKTGFTPNGNVINAGGTLYFSAYATGTGVELYKSDGTNAGTVLLKDIYPGINDSYPEYFANVNGTLFFVARQESFNDREVWKSDGTAAGTVIVKNLQPIPGGGSFPYRLTASNGRLFFTPSQPDNRSGAEPWISNGTEAGTFELKDINYFTNASIPHQNSLLAGNDLYFPVSSIYGNKLAKTDGTEAGTIVLTPTDIAHPDYNYSVQSSTPMVHANGITYFLGNISFYNNTEVWRTDGTVAGTSMLKDIDGDAFTSSQPGALTAMGNNLYFFANTAAAGRELWKTDGTEAGTVLLKDIYPGTGSSGATEMIELNGTLYFKANGNDGASVELWKSDGTAVGTVKVKDINPGAAGSNPVNFAKMGNRIYFTATDNVSGAELWTSDGTEAGTFMVKDINPGLASSNVSQVMALSNRLFFTASTAATGFELWTSDGTEAGTVMVKDIYPGATASSINNITAAGNKIYFVASNGTNGRELWVSDGTEAGTFMTRDIRTGSSDGAIDRLFFADGTLFFTANNGINGIELWSSAGTTATTNMVTDFTPGSQGGVNLISRLPNQLVVGFYTNEYGYEPWVTNLSGVLPVTMLEFNGYLQQQDVKLQWKTINEQNLAYYEVQRGKDGRNFNTIGTQAAANASGTQFYTYTDQGIAGTINGIVYYRLKQVDISGQYSFTKIVPVLIGTAKNKSVLFPNPVADKSRLALKGTKDMNVNARLVDMSGKTLQQWKWKMQGEGQTVELDISNIASGNYMLEINKEGTTEVIPLIKN